jgi:L-threonylcarbamoyladenylate synthase
VRTRVLRVDPLRPEPEAIELARNVLARDGLVVMPTETVYGLAARACSEPAIARVFAAKGRSYSQPLAVQVAAPEMLMLVCADVTAAVRRIVERFMPGPLTLVLSSAGTLPAAVTAGTGKVGVRIPDHPVALAVLRAVGEPLVVTSANLSGQPAATEAGQVLGQFEDRVDLVLDGGPCALGQESTILDMTVLPPRVLRKGAIGWPALAAVLAEPAGTQ